VPYAVLTYLLYASLQIVPTTRVPWSRTDCDSPEEVNGYPEDATTAEDEDEEFVSERAQCKSKSNEKVIEWPPTEVMRVICL
jgi:hypothetical protein